MSAIPKRWNSEAQEDDVMFYAPTVRFLLRKKRMKTASSKFEILDVCAGDVTLSVVAARFPCGPRQQNQGMLNSEVRRNDVTKPKPGV